MACWSPPCPPARAARCSSPPSSSASGRWSCSLWPATTDRLEAVDYVAGGAGAGEGAHGGGHAGAALVVVEQLADQLGEAGGGGLALGDNGGGAGAREGLGILRLVVVGRGGKG